METTTTNRQVVSLPPSPSLSLPLPLPLPLPLSLFLSLSFSHSLSLSLSLSSATPFYASRSNTAQKWSFLLWISSVNVTKSAVSCKVSFPLSSLLFFFEYLLRQGQIEKIDSFLEITFTVFLSSSKCSSKVPIHSQNSHESMVRRRYSLALEKKTPLVSVY